MALHRQYDTDISRHLYPGLARAALEMAYDNGGVTRDRDESVTIDELDQVLVNEGDLHYDLKAISDWLEALPDDDLVIAVAGETNEMAKLMAGAPAGTDDLLNAIFNGPEA